MGGMGKAGRNSFMNGSNLSGNEYQHAMKRRGADVIGLDCLAGPCVWGGVGWGGRKYAFILG